MNSARRGGDAAAGGAVFALWLGLIVVHFDVWHTADLLWGLVLAAVVVHLFHRGPIRWRIVAIVLLPALLLIYLLPQRYKQQFKEWKANEQGNI